MFAALHPPLASFPPVLLVVVLALELLSWRRGLRGPESGVLWLLWALLIVTTGLTFFSGYAASEVANQTFTVADEIIAWHHNWGRLLFFLVVPTAALRWVAAVATMHPRGWHGGYLFMLAVCAGLALYTGYLGGSLVFDHGAGVRAVLSNPGSN